MLFASEYPYRNIVGVEFSQTFHKIAESNIRIWKNHKLKCYSIKSVCIDVLDFKLPQTPLVLFFFTPFKPIIADQVINNIREDFTCNPRPIIIIYYGANQEFMKLLFKLNFLSKIIYPFRPLSALGQYKGYIFQSGKNI